MSSNNKSDDSQAAELEESPPLEEQAIGVAEKDLVTSEGTAQTQEPTVDEKPKLKKDDSVETKLTSDKKPAKKEAKKGGALIWLLMLLVLVALVFSGLNGWYNFNQYQSQREQQTQQKLIGLEKSIASTARQLAVMKAAMQHSESNISVLDQRLDGQNQQLSSLIQQDRSQWRLAEVEYLLRLANQRLLLARDFGAARQLMQSADGILQELGYVDLYAVRKQIAADMVALGRVKAIDTEGVYLRLTAVAKALPSLSFAPEIAQQESISGGSEPEQSGAKEAWAATKAFAEQYIRLSKRKIDDSVLLSVEQQKYLTTRLQLRLEQAKNALLLGQQGIYQQSLDDAVVLLKNYADADQAGATISELLDLKAKAVPTQELPDISRSQRLLKDYLQARTSINLESTK